MFKKYKFYSILFLISIGFAGLFTCAITLGTHSIKKHPVYSKLDKEDRTKINMILNEISGDKKEDYYLDKLKLLLNTPTKINNESNSNRNDIEINRSIKFAKEKTNHMSPEIVKDYINFEEEYEVSEPCDWEIYQPNNTGSFLYVCKDDPINLKVKISVHLLGLKENTEKIKLLEDAIEKHLNIAGFSVNLIFTDREDVDVFSVNTEPEQWTTSYNWTGDYQGLAHELLHLMGLEDEYDSIEVHAGNQSFSVKNRLRYFWNQLSNPVVYADAEEGIMYISYYKPLERHVCKAVGLPIKKCVKDRKHVIKMEAVYIAPE